MDTKANNESSSRAQAIETKLRQAFGEGLIFVAIEDQSGGCGESFRAFIIAKEFDDMKLLERQQKVNGILKEEISEIHAFEMKTWTAAQWEKKKAEFGY